MRTQGAAGLSGLDMYTWRRLCTQYESASGDLCSALAVVGRKLCCSYVDPVGLEAFTSCRLIPLNKDPGIRLIRVGEVPHSKAILLILSPDIEEAAGPLQVCAGHVCGCEAAIHAVQQLFNDSASEGVLLVDAENTFNSLNRMAALHNIEVICPSFSSVLRLVIPGSGEIASCEGITQG